MVELVIERIVNGGDGLARLEDGRVVFVPYTLPGETARVELQDSNRGYYRGELKAVIKPSSHRIEPDCPHFGVCGGCHFQHMDYAYQLETKHLVLQDIFSRNPALQQIKIEPVVPSPAAWRYRNYIQLHQDTAGRTGYRHRNSHEVVPFTDCLLASENLNRLKDALNFESGLILDRIGLRESQDGGLMVVLEGAARDLPEMAVDFPASVIHRSESGEVVLAGDDRLVLEVLERQFQVSAGSFFQINTGTAGLMVRHILSLLHGNTYASILDLYCGVGLFSAFIGPQAERLTGVESSSSACQDFAANLDWHPQVDLYQGNTDAILPALEDKPDVIIADPPRAGLGPKTIDSMIRLAPGHIIYISCDPASLARDLARLSGSAYRIANVTPFDMFPQTSHIETVVLISRI